MKVLKNLIRKALQKTGYDIIPLPNSKRHASYHTFFIDDLENRFAKVSGKKILLVGCNRGLECKILIERGAQEVVGVDIIDEIGTEFQHPRVTYCQTPIEKIPKGYEDYFDLSVSVAVFEHILNPQGALVKMIRSTRTNGLIYIYAGLLWNSHNGNHRQEPEFLNEPWIHLRYNNVSKMRAYYKTKLGDAYSDQIDEKIQYTFSDEFNRVSTEEYKKITARILAKEKINPHLISFVINHESKKYLTPEIARELRKYTMEELLCDSIYWVFTKM